MTPRTLAPGQGRRFGTGITVKVDSGQSPDFVAFESELPPEWAGPPPHRHQTFDEAFYVIDGPVAFTVGDSTDDHSAGSFVFIPRGVTHAFTNPHAHPAKLLIIATPGALDLVEGVYELLGGPDSLGVHHPDMHKMAALYARHHSEIVPTTSR